MASSKLSVVQEKGQVTIPAEIRKKWGLKKGDLVAFVETEQGVMISPQEVIATQALDQIGPGHGEEAAHQRIEGDDRGAEQHAVLDVELEGCVEDGTGTDELRREVESIEEEDRHQRDDAQAAGIVREARFEVVRECDGSVAGRGAPERSCDHDTRRGSPRRR